MKGTVLRREGFLAFGLLLLSGATRADEPSASASQPSESLVGAGGNARSRTRGLLQRFPDRASRRREAEERLNTLDERTAALRLEDTPDEPRLEVVKWRLGLARRLLERGDEGSAESVADRAEEALDRLARKKGQP